MGNVSASLSFNETFSDIFDHEKFTYLAKSTTCVKFHTSDDLSRIIKESSILSCL